MGFCAAGVKDAYRLAQVSAPDTTPAEQKLVGVPPGATWSAVPSRERKTAKSSRSTTGPIDTSMLGNESQPVNGWRNHLLSIRRSERNGVLQAGGSGHRNLSRSERHRHALRDPQGKPQRSLDPSCCRASGCTLRPAPRASLTARRKSRTFPIPTTTRRGCFCAKRLDWGEKERQWKAAGQMAGKRDVSGSLCRSASLRCMTSSIPIRTPATRERAF